MPFIHIRITDEGVTRQQKKRLVQLSTQMMVDVLKKNPATTHVVIDEVSLDNWGLDSQLVSDLRCKTKSS